MMFKNPLLVFFYEVGFFPSPLQKGECRNTYVVKKDNKGDFNCIQRLYEKAKKV